MNVVNHISDSVLQYRSRIRRKKDFFQYARSTSTSELLHNITQIAQAKNKKDLINPLLTLSKHSVWIGRTGWHYLSSFLDLRFLENKNHFNSKAQEILAGVANNRTVEATDNEVFRTIYDELIYSHLHENYKCPINVPKIDMTIVLVSGVFNEIFSTPAFKRGAEKLLDDYKIKHIAPSVSGRKGSKENAKNLKKQIDHYIKNHPEEKLWFFCFSKGGVDTLHYLKAEGETLSKNIIGVSFIATPLLGSEHLNHKLLKLANAVGKAPEIISHKILGKRPDLILTELQNSLSKPYRESWFKRNYKLLPKNLFYTAIAFESGWKDAHVYMIMTKAMFRSKKSNDGIVDVENAQFPNYFNGMNLGVIDGHHLVGSRSSFYDQEALMKSHLIFLRYKKQI
jgi:hypothetical protein